MPSPNKRAPKKAAKKSGSGKQAKSQLIFPTGRISSLLRKGRYSKRVSGTSGVYMAAVLEYLTAELLELSVKAAQQKKSSQRRITPRAITLAVRCDEDLGALLKDTDFTGGGVPLTTKPVKKKGTAKKKTIVHSAKTKAQKSGLSRESSSGHMPFQSRLALARKADDDMTAKDAEAARSLADKGSLTHVWKFRENHGRFESYDSEASVLVEQAYARWLVNPEIDVRAVKSGDWEYMVDFNNMQQQNVKHHAHTIRDVKRVPI